MPTPAHDGPGPGPALLGGTAIKPPEHHGWDAVKYFLHDKEHGTYMGRTPKSWGLIFIFYVIYYACLAAFWALMMYIFLLTIDSKTPKWTGKESIIGTSPGLGLRPNQPEATIDSSMIIFNKDSVNGTETVPGWNVWSSKVKDFMTTYKNKGKACGRNSRLSSTGKKDDEDADDACQFKISSLGKCAQNQFGYDKGQPCVYFKLNKIFDNENQPFDDPTQFPKEMPEDLQKHIRKQGDKNQVWVNCRGEYPADEEAMGPLTYYPTSRGFPAMYFPYKNQDNYESPVVAVHFTNPKIGQLLHIECRAWAKNIKYHRMDRLGMVHFELYVLDAESAKAHEEALQ